MRVAVYRGLLNRRFTLRSGGILVSILVGPSGVRKIEATEAQNKTKTQLSTTTRGKTQNLECLLLFQAQGDNQIFGALV